MIAGPLGPLGLWAQLHGQAGGGGQGIGENPWRTAKNLSVRPGPVVYPTPPTTRQNLLSALDLDLCLPEAKGGTAPSLSFQKGASA